MTNYKLDGRIWEAESQMPLFQATVTIYIMQEDDQQPTGRQQEILASLQNTPNDLLLDIKTCAMEYYREIDSVVNLTEEGKAIDERSLEQHFRIKSVLIPEIRNCSTNYCFMSFDCDWEEEHGMQVLLADGKIIACGQHSSLPFSPQWAQAISIPDKIQQISYLNSLSIY